MKKVDYSQAISPLKQPVLEQTLDHMQIGQREALSSVIKALVKDYTVGDVVILEGCINTGINPAYSISAGSIYYNGEVYQVASVSGTLTGANVVIGTITTSYDLAIDPINFQPGNISKSVHQIVTMNIGQGLTTTGTKDYSAMKSVVSHRSLLAATGSPQTISSVAPTWVDLTSITVTTPNDGRTRMYLVIFTCSSTQSNGNVSSQLELQLLQGAVQLDIKHVGKLNATSTTTMNLDTAMIVPVLVPANTIIKVQGRRTNSDVTIEEQKLFAIELF